MAPFEALYGRRCRTPLSWSQTGERKIFEPDLVTEAENKVKVIQANLKAAQSRQKSYADKRRKPLQFEVGDHVYLWVSPTKGVHRFGLNGKLAPRYIGPFEILERCGPLLDQCLMYEFCVYSCLIAKNFQCKIRGILVIMKITSPFLQKSLA